MPEKHIPLIMEIIDKIVAPDYRMRKYTDRQIVKLLTVLQIFNISYKSARTFLINHKEYIRMAGIKEIHSFQTLSRRARMIYLHAVNNEITSLYSTESIGAVDVEYIWDPVNRDCDTAIGLITIAYNLMIISNTEIGEKPRRIMKIVSC